MGILMESTYVILVYYFKKNLARANGLASAAVGVALFLLPPLSQALIDYYGWNGALLIIAGLVANNGVAAALFRPSRIELDIKSKSKQNSYEKHTMELKKSVNEPIEFDQYKPLETSHETKQFTRFYTSLLQHVKLLKNLKCLSVIISLFWFSIGYSMVTTFNPARAAIVGLTPYQAAQLVSIMGITTCFARLTHGFILDYNIMSVASLTTISNIVSALCCIMNPVDDRFEYLAAIAAIFGISGGITNSVPPVIFNKYAGTGNISEAIAFSLVSFGLGALIGYYITGKLEDVYRDALAVDLFKSITKISREGIPYARCIIRNSYTLT